MCLTPKITTHGNGITRSPFDPRIENNLTNSLIDDLDIVDNCSYISHEELHDVDPTSDTLSILQLNMQGLINKQSDLNKLLHAESRNKVCVALLCETWLQKEMTQLVNIPNFSLISKERKGKKGGEVGILTQEDLKVRHRPDLEIDTNVMENAVAELKGDKDRILLASCYRVPNTNQTEFLSSYSKLLDK